MSGGVAAVAVVAVDVAADAVVADDTAVASGLVFAEGAVVSAASSKVAVVDLVDPGLAVAGSGAGTIPSWRRWRWFW